MGGEKYELWGHGGLRRSQFQSIPGKVQIFDMIVTHPMEHHAGGLRMLLKRGYRVPVLGLRGRRALEACKIGRDPRQIVLPDFCTEGGDAAIGVEREEEVVAAFDEGGQHRLHQRIIGIDQDVVGLEAVELKSKMNHLERCGTQQGMAEAETGIRYFRGDDLDRPERQETVLLLPLFDHPQGKAGGIGGDEFPYEWPVDDKPGQQRLDVTVGGLLGHEGSF
jgi:hypothetical protein